MKLEFTVYGTPVSQGSMRAFIPKGWNRAIITSDNPKLKSWRQDLSKSAMLACKLAKGPFPVDRKIPVQVVLWFFFRRPKSVKGEHKTTKPDADKLMRSALDGMTGIVYFDDSQVSDAIVHKRFDANERVEITVETLQLT